ncbi:MAG: lysophospholipid acyltransferase family protein [Thermoleophilia bacterium]
MSGGPVDERVHWFPPAAGLSVPLWRFARAVLEPTTPWLVGFRVAGRRRMPRSGGVLVVANHVGDIDPLFVGLACVPRPAQYMALSMHFTSRPVARLLFQLGAFPIRVGEADVRAMRYAREQLAVGRVVVMFPEGSPSWGGPMGEFHEGMGNLGLTPGTAVVPMAVWGTHRILRERRVVGRGPVFVAVGEPLAAAATGSRRQRAADLTARARASVAALLDPIARAHP